MEAALLVRLAVELLTAGSQAADGAGVQLLASRSEKQIPIISCSRWVGSIHVYVDDVDAVYGRAIRLRATTMSRQKTYRTTSAKRALSIREVTRGGVDLKQMQ